MREQKIYRAPTYAPEAVQPMRDELVAVGFEDLRTAHDMDKVVGGKAGTLLIMINSVCGCAAGSVQPGVALTLQHHVIPDRLITVFAGMEHDVVERVRALHAGYPPSSPSLVLVKGGDLVAMVERRGIGGKTPEQLASDLKQLFTRHCSRPGPSIPASEFAKIERAPPDGGPGPLGGTAALGARGGPTLGTREPRVALSRRIVTCPTTD